MKYSLGWGPIVFLLAFIFVLHFILFNFEFPTTIYEHKAQDNNTTPSVKSLPLPFCDPDINKNLLRTTATNCPNTDKWMKKFVKHDGSSTSLATSKNVIFIGCNKGVDAANAFSLFDYSRNPYDSQLWKSALKQVNPLIDRGACGQVTSHTTFDDVHNHSLKDSYGMEPTVYCVEAMPNNVKLLQRTQRIANISYKNFIIFPFAIGNPAQVTQVSFPDGNTGYEALGLSHAGIPNSHYTDLVNVTLVSIDSLFQQIPTVDFLSIDTEGNDPDVLFGARQTLTHTRYLEFEVHRDIKESSWAKNSLKSVIDYLDDLQFDCFWSANNGKLIQVTNCWHNYYEKYAHNWRNIACVKRNDPWHSIIRDIYSSQIESIEEYQQKKTSDKTRSLLQKNYQ